MVFVAKCVADMPALLLLRHLAILHFVTSFGGFLNRHGPQPHSYEYSNFTYKEISALLRKKGYRVLQVPNSPPLVLYGDVAYAAYEVLSEPWSLEARGDTNAVKGSRLWMDKTGKIEMFYFYDTKNPPNKTFFEKPLQHWSKHTCINAVKIKDRGCDDQPAPHGAVCAGNFGELHCYTTVGNRFSLNGHYYQVHGIQGCGMYISTRLFGTAMGLSSYSVRADRDQFIIVNLHNVMIDVTKKGNKTTGTARWKAVWKSTKKCQKGVYTQTEAPLPYDYMSIMANSEADFGDDDFKLVYVTKDPRHQYMIDYKKYSGLLSTHFDRYLVNLMYKCNERRVQSCKTQGITPPKCKNFGYLTQDCKCACPTGRKGSSCEQKTGNTFFPIQQRAKTFVEYPGPGEFTLKQHSKMEGTVPQAPLSEDFQYSQYATIILKAREKGTMVSVSVFEPGEVVRHPSLNSAAVNKYIEGINKQDCKLGLRLYWGDFPTGRIRTECFSTLVTNEPKVNAIVLRARSREVGIVIIGHLGRQLRSADFTKLMLESLVFQVSFPRNASVAMKVGKVNDGSDASRPPTGGGSGGAGSNSSGGAGGSGSGDKPISGGTAAAIALPSAGGSALAILSLVPLCCLCVLIPICLVKRKKKKKEPDEEVEVVPSVTSSGSATSDSNYDTD